MEKGFKQQKGLTTPLHTGRGWGWVLLLLILPFTSYAQDQPEYRMEVGGGLGLAAYQGDFNGSLLRGMQPMAALTAKYRMNPRMAFAANLGLGKLKGSSDNVDTWYPALRENPITFSSTLTYLDLRFEYNFWAFGTGEEYHGARPLTPFFAIGTGLVVAKPDKTVAGLQMPIGLGIKYKVRPRLNLTAEWMMHFSSCDRLDGIKDPYGIESSGLFKNTDCFSTIQVTLTYDIWAKCKTCNNDRD